jgi:small conductance mechanosensitive channel
MNGTLLRSVLSLRSVRPGLTRLLLAACLPILAADATPAAARPLLPSPQEEQENPLDPADGGIDADTLATDTLPVVDLPFDALPGRATNVEELLSIYRRMLGLRDVRIRLEGRILELEGHALSAEDRERAVEHARTIVDGVVYVDHSGLVVETDVRKRLEPALERIREKSIAFLRFLPALLLGLAILAVGVVVAVWIGRRDRLFGGISRNIFARNLARKVVRGVVVLIALLLALDLMGVTALVGAVLGAAGVAGIALGFAFRDIVENHLAGILLSLRQPFAPNDHVMMEGAEGRIIRLTGRETVLMTLEGNHVRIPNATIYKSIITNLTRNPRRQFQFKVGIAPWEAVGQAMRVARDAVAGVPGVLGSPAPGVQLHALLDSAVSLQVTGWVDQTDTDFAKARSQALRAVKEAFEEAGIDTPPPEYGIRMLEGSPDAPAPRPERARSAGAGQVPVAEDIEVDVAPDTTIEDEIARELRTSTEENLLEPPAQATGGPEEPGGRPSAGN